MVVDISIGQPYNMKTVSLQKSPSESLVTLEEVIRQSYDQVLLEIRTVIVDIINLLSAKKSSLFIEEFVDPSVSTVALNSERIEESIHNFERHTAPKLLAYLSMAKYMEPKMSGDLDSAYYDHPAFENKIIFQKINNNWYLKD